MTFKIFFFNVENKYEVKEYPDVEKDFDNDYDKCIVDCFKIQF